MSRGKIQGFAQKALSMVLSVALLNFPVSAGPKEKSEDPGVSDVKVKLDDVGAKKVLSTQLGNLISGISPSDANYDACKKAALLVAQDAVDNYGYWNTFMDLLAQTAQGIELGATLGGQPTVAKVAQVAGTIVEAFNDEDPAGALGQALVNESVGWAAGKAKSGNDTVDDAVKQAAEKAKDKLIKKLFPGKRQKGKTHHTTVGNCTVDVTPEFEWPGQGIGQRGGLRLYVYGDCECKKPLKLNMLDFRAQPDEIKNCGLGNFGVVAFVPLTRLETSVSFGGKPVDLTKLLGKAAKLKKAVQDAIAGKKTEEDPKDIAKELKDLVGKGTKLKATVSLRPVFGKMELKDLYAKCGDCPDPVTTQPPPPTETAKTSEPTTTAKETDQVENVCKECQTQFDIWKNLRSDRQEFGWKLMQWVVAKQDPPESAKDEYRSLVKREDEAKAEYDRCVEQCKKRTQAKETSEGSPSVSGSPGKQTNTPPVKTPTLGDGAFKSIQPDPEDETGRGQVAYMPPSASSGSTILTTVIDPNEEGPHGVVIATVDENGKHNFFKGATDRMGKMAFLIPVGTTAVDIVQLVGGGPPKSLAHTQVGTPAHIPNTEPIPQEQVPGHGPAITEMSTIIERGGSNPGTVILHTQGTDPLKGRAFIDDQPMPVLAASDTSMVAQPPAGVANGPHSFSVETGGVKSNSVQSDLAAVRAEPIPIMHTGGKANVVLHVEGVPAEHNPVVHFEVTGAARLATGAASADVPVKNGIASVPIQGEHPGQVVVNYQLRAMVRGSGLSGGTRLGKDIRPADYTMMDGIVREYLRKQGENPNNWRVTSKNGDGGLTYTSANGSSLSASFDKGQIVIR